MIVKKIARSKGAPAKSKTTQVRALADYIAGPHAGGDGEKVEHRGGLNFLNIDHDGQVEEMIDLAELARHSPRPVQHWIMSWREGEHPTRAQVDQAVGLFLDEMGLASHQVIYALHRDTDNSHVHIAVNRVHPKTERLVTVNGRFDREVAHRAIARIEHIQGWQGEIRGLYRVQEDGRTERARPRDERERKPSVRARDLEERTGGRSAERVAIEEGAPAIRMARSWRELHKVLESLGMRLERKGSGGILWVGDQPVKTSSAGRDCSMSALAKRLGEFEPARETGREAPRARAPEPIMPSAPGWQQYIDARGRYYRERSVRRERLAERHRDDRQRMTDRHRGERTNIFRRSWKGRGPLLNATRSMLATRQAQDWAEQRDRHELERGELRRNVERFPTFEEWLRHRDHELAEGWRNRDREPARIEGPTLERPAPQDIRAFAPRIEGWRVDYRRVGERSSPAFTDRGREIHIHEADRRETVLAALQLSAQKWGTFTIYGSERFKKMCVELAAEHGLKISNPELQPALSAERERIRTRGPEHPTERRQPDGPEPARPRRRLSRSGPER